MQNAKQPFEQENSIKPPKRLFYRIIERLKIEQSLIALEKRLSFYSIALTVSAVLLGLAIISFVHTMAESDLGPFLSLLISDSKAAMAYWQDIVISILEAMPSIYIIAVLSTLLILMSSLRFTVRYFDRIMSLLKLIRK